MKRTVIPQILSNFKNICNSKGWVTSENDDWIRIESEYHNFLWTRSIHLSSFKIITSRRKCVIHKELSYDVVEASYLAWLFSESPSKKLIKTVLKNPEFYRRTAIYNLSPMIKGERQVFKLNNTKSPVFKTFENFLTQNVGIDLNPIVPRKMVSGEHVVAKPA